jgi:hypothetical protein
MSDQRLRINCRTCSETTSLRLAGYYPDGSQALLCSRCEKDGGVLHQCPHSSPFAQPSWLPLLLAGIEIVCPNCRAAYDLGVKIEPQYPEAGEALKVAGLFVGTLIMVGIISDVIRGGKRRR